MSPIKFFIISCTISSVRYQQNKLMTINHSPFDKTMHFIISATFSISVTLVKYKKATKSLKGMDVKIARVILYWIFF